MKSRSDYHHGDLRAALLKEARSVVEATGASGLSLRACARAVGVDVSAAYRHFKNKGEVLAAVAAVGFQDLGRDIDRRMNAAGRTPATAVETFQATGEGYVCFGVDHPHLYHLMFGGRSDKEAVEAQLQRCEVPGAHTLLSEALDLLEAGGFVVPERREGAEFFVWSMVHGVVSLINTDRGPYKKDDAAAAVERIGHLMLGGMAPRDR